jgi:hypothetical protein
MSSFSRNIAVFTVLTLFFYLNIINLQATNYYFSERLGNNSNSGKSIHKAWKTTDMLNRIKLRAGDSVLFERNGRYEGGIKVNTSGTLQKPIVISAYGKGNYPLITGATILKPTITKSNLIETEINKQVYQLYCNDSLQTLARIPDNGFFAMGQGIEKSGFHNLSVLPDDQFVGSTIRMRTIDWVYENRIIESCLNGEVKFSTPSIYSLSKGYGYYLENKPEFLNMPGEWFAQNGIISYIPFSGYTDMKIEATILKTAITISEGVQNVRISELQIEKYGCYGIHLKKNTRNIRISNSFFRQIEQIGVFADSCANAIEVSNNTFENIRGRGIFGIRVTNCKFTHNKVLNTGIVKGLGMSGVNGMIAIVIQNDEANHSVSVASGNYIANNYVDTNGYAGIRMDGTKSICERNIVKNSALLLNDAGAIYCFGKVKNKTTDNIIRNNLVIGVVGNNDATPNNPFAANGIYVDNNSRDILVTGNTVLNIVSNGIVVNDNSNKITITKNTVFNADKGIAFSEWANKDSIYGCTTTDNIVICSNAVQNPVSLLTYMGKSLKPGNFSNNTYVNAHDNFVIEYRNDPEKGVRRRELYRIENWQRAENQEQNSKTLTVPNVKVLYNDSFEIKRIDNCHNRYKGLNNKELPEIIELEPCESLVVADTSIL